MSVTTPTKNTSDPPTTAAATPKTTSPAPQWASTADAAARFKVNPKTVRRWIAAGIITGYRAGPRLVRVDMTEIDAMLRPIPTAGGPDVAA